MVTEPIATALEVADVLQDMMAQTEAIAEARRAANDLPEGTLLGEIELKGQQVKWRKQKSMVRSGNTPLPERFAAFDKFGMLSMLPTAQMSPMLTKPRADSPGERAFHTHTRGMTRESCPTCPTPRAAITETCEFCMARTGGKVKKVFYSEADAYSHKKHLHPDELENLQRTLEREERRAQVEAQQAVANAMLEMVRLQSANASHAATAPEDAPKPRGGNR